MVEGKNIAKNANSSKLCLLTYCIKNRFNVFYTVLTTVIFERWQMAIAKYLQSF